MGFLVPKTPAAAKITPTAAPTTDDQRVRASANNSRDRALGRRDTADTIGNENAGRRTGGLASAIRQTVGG